MPGGINIDCLAYPAPVANIILTTVAEEFTLAEIKKLAEWKEKIQEDLTVWIPSAVEGYENTTDDPAINTTPRGRKITRSKPVPSGVFYLSANFCDFNEILRTLKGTTLRAFFVLEDGAIMGYHGINSAKYKGFLVEATAVTKGIPMPDAVENSFPLYLNFKHTYEFEQKFAIMPDWDVQAELPVLMPESYALFFVSATQGTATVVVDVFERCGDAIDGLTTADIDVIDNDLTDDTLLSVTDNGDGNYSIAFTTAAAGQFVKFRIKELTGTVVDALSNPIYCEF